MSIEILMPALSPTMTEGNLTKWLVNEGQEDSASCLKNDHGENVSLLQSTRPCGIIAKLSKGEIRFLGWWKGFFKIQDSY